MALDEDLQNRLAHEVQRDFPLERRCWEVLGDRLGASGGAVLDQLRAWARDGRLSEISAVLDPGALDHQGALCALSVPEERAQVVANVINRHPTVTHNHLRDHALNMWFTLSVPAEMGITSTVRALERAAGVEDVVVLAPDTTLKSVVDFDLASRASLATQSPSQPQRPLVLTRDDKIHFRALQVPLPLRDDPFDYLGRLTGLGAKRILAFGQAHLGGALRRYCGTFDPRRIGIGGNAMVAWAVPDDDRDPVALELSAAPEVSHCHAHHSHERFPYTLFTVVHGQDREAVRGAVDRLAERTGVEDRVILFSTRELKKTRMRYFLPQLYEWWDAHGTTA